jgi:hypothetical protein
MSKVICVACGDETYECPDDFPTEWKGYCPGCAVGKMFAGELPKCDFGALMKVLPSVLVEVVVEDEVPDLDMAMTATGQVVYYHKPELCEGQFCPMHNPSEHHMREWPMHARGDLVLPMIDRVCPHDALHPDPDSLAWALRQKADFKWYHGACDGCCTIQPTSAHIDGSPDV